MTSHVRTIRETRWPMLALVFTLLAPLQEFDATRLDNTSGMLLVGAGMFIFLLWLARKVKQQGTGVRENQLTPEERPVNFAP